jgi:hypothetical protein
MISRNNKNIPHLGKKVEPNCRWDCLAPDFGCKKGCLPFKSSGILEKLQKIVDNFDF